MLHNNDFYNQSKNVAVSVIIPAYNCERSIEGLIVSLKKQSFQNFEAIIVDDGSTDKTNSNLAKFINGDSRFILFTKENGGPGPARNNGIQKAIGEYITFADSDDYFDQDFIKKMYEEAIKNDSDMVVCGYSLSMKSNTGQMENRIITLQNSETAHKMEVTHLFTDLLKNMLAFSVWNKMIKRSLIYDNDIKFENYSIAEDRLFVLEVISHCNKVSFIKDPLYFYTLSINGNQTRKYNKDRYLAMRTYCEKLLNYYRESGYEEGEKIVKETLIKAVLSTLVAHYDKSCKLNMREKSKCFKKILNDTFLNTVLNNHVKVGKVSAILSLLFKSKIIMLNKLMARNVYFVLVNFPQIVNDYK